MNIRLRDYQITGIDDIINTWKHCNSILFQMPTGTGKTTLFCEIVRKFTTELFPNKKVLIITHRKELVEQVFNRLVSGCNTNNKRHQWQKYEYKWMEVLEIY
jgi:superfamily II DNA or RNA helicase